MSEKDCDDDSMLHDDSMLVDDTRDSDSEADLIPLARALKSKQKKPKPGSDSEGDDVPIASTLNKKVTHKKPIMGSKLYKATTGNSTQSFGSPLKEYLLGEVQSYVSFQELHPLLLCKFPCCLA